MGRRKQETQEVQEAENEPSWAAGVLVAVVLAGVVVGVAFAVDEAAGVLLVTVAGGVALFRSASRKGTDQALPSPTAGPSRPGISAAQKDAATRAAYDPNGVMCTYHLPDGEETG